jgi:hypothetical protein
VERNISEAILSHISNFTVALVLRKNGAGSEVLGSFCPLKAVVES